MNWEGTLQPTDKNMFIWHDFESSVVCFQKLLYAFFSSGKLSVLKAQTNEDFESLELSWGEFMTSS